MKALSITALLLAAAAIACSPPASHDSPELAAQGQAWAEALNAGDIEALMSVYTADARLLPPNAEMAQGSDAVRAAFSGMIDAGLKGELDTIEARVAGDMGYRLGRYELKTPDGMIVDRGKYIETWRMIDGEWKLTNDIWNSDMAGGHAGTSVIITHEVADSDRWLAAWQGDDSRHEMFAQNGAPKIGLYQSPDNAKYKALWINVEDMDAFQAFMQSDETAAAKKADGVKDRTLRVYEAVE